MPCLFPLCRPPPAATSALVSATACRTTSGLRRARAHAASPSALQDRAGSLSTAPNPSHLRPHAAPGLSSPRTPSFAPSCTAQPPHRADPARCCFACQSTLPLHTVHPGTIHACELEVATASGLTLWVLTETPAILRSSGCITSCWTFSSLCCHALSLCPSTWDSSLPSPGMGIGHRKLRPCCPPSVRCYAPKVISLDSVQFHSLGLWHWFSLTFLMLRMMGISAGDGR
jgi:hypothetical protein